MFHRTRTDISSLMGLVSIKKWNHKLIDYQVQKEEYTDPFSMFVYAIRFPYTKESYFRRLRIFFDAIDLDKGRSMEERCNTFAYNGRKDSSWAFSGI